MDFTCSLSFPSLGICGSSHMWLLLQLVILSKLLFEKKMFINEMIHFILVGLSTITNVHLMFDEWIILVGYIFKMSKDHISLCFDLNG